MKRNLQNVWFQLAVFFFCSPHFHAEFKCAEFDFPGLKNSTVTSLENSSLVLSFKVQGMWCTSGTLKDFNIEVVKKESDQIYCNISHENGECSVTFVAGTRCTCPQNGTYKFEKTANRSDSGEWIWRGERILDKSLTFNIEDSPHTHKPSAAADDVVSSTGISQEQRQTDLTSTGSTCAEEVTKEVTGAYGEVDVTEPTLRTNPNSKAPSGEVGVDSSKQRTTWTPLRTLVTIVAVVALVVIFIKYCVLGKGGAEFQFPDVKNNAIRRFENSDLTLAFRLQQTAWCLDGALKDFNIEVAKKQKGSEKIYCKIADVNGRCSVKSFVGARCTCPEAEGGMYKFVKRSDRTDNGEWIWRSTEDTTQDKSIIFNIEYAADIKSLTLTGTPPHEVKANGPPKITLDEVMFDTDVELRFAVRSHTKNLVHCRLWKLPKSVDTLIHISSSDKVPTTVVALSTAGAAVLCVGTRNNLPSRSQCDDAFPRLSGSRPQCDDAFPRPSVSRPQGNNSRQIPSVSSSYYNNSCQISSGTSGGYQSYYDNEDGTEEFEMGVLEIRLPVNEIVTDGQGREISLQAELRTRSGNITNCQLQKVLGPETFASKLDFPMLLVGVSGAGAAAGCIVTVGVVFAVRMRRRRSAAEIPGLSDNEGGRGQRKRGISRRRSNVVSAASMVPYHDYHEVLDVPEELEMGEGSNYTNQKNSKATCRNKRVLELIE
ncbi:hypothetical protein BaRGS_00038431, partial [Batillaria attramentaria]